MALGKKVGFFGGTFDPPHHGHVALAQQAAAQAGLTELLWVITPITPAKEIAFSSPEQRMQMVELAIANQPFSRISTVELDRDPPYYTVETARILRQQLAPEDELFYLMGGDSLRHFPKWVDADELLFDLLSGILIARRPGDRLDLDAIDQSMPGIRKKIVCIQLDEIHIASSEIRTKIQSGLPVDDFLSPEVLRYMRENRLYLNLQDFKKERIDHD